MFRRVFQSKLLHDNFRHQGKLTRHLMEIKVHPDEPLVDEKVHIIISGLKPHQEVTVRSSVTEVKSRFSSSACYISDIEGNVFIHKQQSLSGTYTGNM